MPVAGIAFAGDRGISKVEVSIDGGSTWKSASIKDPVEIHVGPMDSRIRANCYSKQL